MNEHLLDKTLLTPRQPATTQAADGMLRRAWSLAEIEAMVRAGIIDEDERFEMIGGEVVPMSPKGARHEMVKIDLNRHFQQIAPAHLSIAPETTLRLDERSFVEPDFCVFPRDLDLKSLDGSRVLLAVEVADTSLYYDLGRKIGIYAAYGIREVWVVNALTLVTRVHRRLGASGYSDIIDHDYSAIITPMLVPELATGLAALGLTPSQIQS